MKQIFIAFICCFLMTLFACKDDNEVDNPTWIDNWIEKIDNDQYCPYCEIYRYEFEGAYYYELYSPIFSCHPCQVHDASGTVVDATFNVQEYVEKRKGKTLIYKME